MLCPIQGVMLPCVTAIPVKYVHFPYVFQRRRRIFLNRKMAEEIADHFYIALFTYKRVSVNPKYVRCTPIKT